MSAKTVFISYRRDSSGKPFARLLEQALTHEGYDVFLDVDDVDSGKWADQILTQVPLSAHFLLVLTPGALDRCAEQNDWVRREFELAIESGRNIVPVREESVDFGKLRKECPESMKGLFDLQIATVQHHAFKRDVEVLIERYIPPHKAPKEKQAKLTECLVSPTRLLRGAEKLFGREEELAALDQVWNDPSKKVLTIVAFGGIGKTSLVIDWMARQAAKNWEGFERVFDWSFFSQGTREKGGPSADTFVAAALRFFGDEAMAQSAASAWDKAARLAQLVAQRRMLLVLDGVEPLQHPPGTLAGELKDPALATLLKGLARSNSGLCIVTTRERVADLAPFRDTTAPEWQLHHLSNPAGVELLKTLGVRGTAAEFQQLVERVKGHALTLNLLGRYLAKAHGGDIRKSDQVKFEKADAATQGGYAFKTIGAYEEWLREGGTDGARQLAVLRLLGLFARPADAGCLTALRRQPVIAGLTEPLVGLDDDDWNLIVSALEECGLLSRVAQRKTPNSELETALDAHPFIREYFATKLRENRSKAWRAAHRRLYEHLVKTTDEGDEPSLEDLQPLYEAVAHGCQARKEMEAWAIVYRKRILRKDYYSRFRLGAFASDCEIARHLLNAPWALHTRLLGFAKFMQTHLEQYYGKSRGAYSRFIYSVWTLIEVRRTLTKAGIRASLLNDLSVCLMATGRLEEAREALLEEAQLRRSRTCFENLAYLELASGNLQAAMAAASKAVGLAEQNGAEEGVWSALLVLKMACEHAGQGSRLVELKGRLRHLIERKIGFDTFVSLTLTRPDRAAWRRILGSCADLMEGIQSLNKLKETFHREPFPDSLGPGDRVKDYAERQLIRGRIGFYEHLLTAGTATDPPSGVLEDVERAIKGFRDANSLIDLPKGLLTRAWLRFLRGQHVGAESAQSDLEEAWEIAERGPMRLFMADIHLYRARLFHGVKPYPWTTDADGKARGPKDDLAAARKLIEQCGYWRRKEELEDAEEAAKNW